MPEQETKTKPRLWGAWSWSSFPSGTQIVKLTNCPPDKPHLYVYGPMSGDDTGMQRDRAQMCIDLAVFLSGGDRPAWLDDFTRPTESRLEALDGSKILATGPMYDADPPKLNWKQDESDAAKDSRARLIDTLWIKPEDTHA